MKALYDVPAPAKLNLFLHVTGRRADGMHLLQSAFMLIDWADTLHFELRAGGAISREDIGAALPADDLVLRAARALQAAAGTGHGAHITIDKRVPAQAGMGGGSSDAASCLLALNRLWQLNLPVQTLARIGLQLGADVPFFLFGRNAWAEGVGEKLAPLALPPARFAVVKPDVGLATAQIFNDPKLKRDTPTAIISGFAANPYGFGTNDLQAVAQGLCPAVGDALEWLASQGLQGRMTGSGSAVFAQMPVQPSGGPAGKPLKAAPEGWQVRECSNLVAHPLAGWAPSDD
ncbi:4-(cytidine 5'-diphospho)-2-C-methyl-D-erythritol kinase [Caenimonas koreensis]|uniref:4-diphosphocytidyl-2-C-methyl-D-erythritol kinase n=1 Tax=Caenimonas koreensis DSM 17982 TaxID=1121255 RepID=A0A844B0Z2_9BURK|nr:4-(cytidine 5'-diphospho)-2-C-methyl-D-erythritol kinase [Caenimonas koreensis]MRD48388.1 4-(cytidine 5'-diphospho)-2-C-methyl-D-erythritol kinase [Caenimonas koreensis DSM 17982]